MTILPESRQPLTPERSGPIQKIKDAVPIEQVAAEYGEFKLVGPNRLLGRCVASDHEDRTPSMTVYTDTQRFKCFGCGIAGDVIDLEELGGRHIEAWTTVSALAERYGVEVTTQRRQKHEETKTQIRRKMRDGLTKVYQRRFYRMLHDAGAHAEDDALLWESMYPAAYLAATERVFGE